MDGADRTTSALERRVVDMAEAWALRERVGEVLQAVAVDVQRGEVEVQVAEPPIRASVDVGDAAAPQLGARLDVRVAAADVAEGRIRLELVG